MKMIQTSHWSMPLPDEWQSELDDDTVVIFDQDEVSTLELSMVELDGGEVELPDLEELASELVPQGVSGQTVELGDFAGLLFEYEDEDYCRDWLLAHDSRVLLVSYTCEPDHRGMDDAAVNELLSELRLLDEGDA